MAIVTGSGRTGGGDLVRGTDRLLLLLLISHGPGALLILLLDLLLLDHRLLDGGDLRLIDQHIGQRGGELNQAVIELAQGDRPISQLKAKFVDDLAADGVRDIRCGPLNIGRVDDDRRGVCTSGEREDFRWSVRRLDDWKWLLLLRFRAKSELQRLPLLPAAILLRVMGHHSRVHFGPTERIMSWERI